MAKDCWYNTSKGVSKDNDGDEVKITQDNEDGYETIIFMVMVT